MRLCRQSRESDFEARPSGRLKAEGDGKPLLVHTPGQKTIEDVARFLGVSPKNKIKTLALMAQEKDGKTGKM